MSCQRILICSVNIHVYVLLFVLNKYQSSRLCLWTECATRILNLASTPVYTDLSICYRHYTEVCTVCKNK